MERLSDAGSIPARSIFGVKENACFYRHFLFLIFLQALSEKLFIETTTIKSPQTENRSHFQLALVTSKASNVQLSAFLK